MLRVLHVFGVCRKKKDIRRKSNGFELLPPPAGGPPPSRREVFGEGCGGRASIVERGRRVIGATAKPLYAIGGKTEGFVGRVTLWETIA